LRDSCRPSLSLHLFFGSGNTKFVGHSSVVFEELAQPDVSFPYLIELQCGNGPSQVATRRPLLNEKPFDSNDKLLIRLMEWKDVKAVTDICINEYGEKPDTTNVFSSEFWSDWSEYFALRPLVDLSMRLKVNGRASRNKTPEDHIVLIACLSSGMVNDLSSKKQSHVVGMIELSLQPLQPERNPPPVPIPLALKKVRYGGNLQGWITNLLVVPGYRGRGIAKVLLAACEGIARKWKCRSISLHCDADSSSGMIPQQLYAKLGYLPLKEAPTSAGYSWIAQPAETGPYVTSLTTSVFVIDDVPLLYLFKTIE
jgi:GNAT superfamily N-acetyltransferase